MPRTLSWKVFPEWCLMCSALTVSHFVSCHDHIIDVMKQAVVIAQRRLSCHLSTLGQKRQLGICHQDVVFFRADPQFLIMSRIISLITSSSVVDCGWSALSVVHGPRHGHTVSDRVTYQLWLIASSRIMISSSCQGWLQCVFYLLPVQPQLLFVFIHKRFCFD